MNTYWRVLGFAKPLGKFAIPYFFYAALHAIFNTFNFMLIIPILDTLFNANDAVIQVTSMPAFTLNTQYLSDLINFILYKTYGGTYQIMDVLIMLAIVEVVSMFLSNLFRYLAQWTVESMRITTLYRLRNSVFDNVMNLHVGFFNNERKGDIISKISSDVQVVQFCVTNTLQVFFRDPFLIIGYMLALVNISWELTIFTLIFLPAIAFFIGMILKSLRKKATKAQETFSTIVSTLDESLTGIKIIKAYGAAGYIKDKFHGINHMYSDILLKMAKRQQLASPMSEFLGVSAVAVILIFGGSLVLKGSLSAAGFIAYIGIFSQITRPVRAIADAYSNINQGIAAGERVLQLMDTKSLITDTPNSIELKDFNEDIEFRNVQFSYETRDVINGISFKIKKGETVALVGTSGGGKSTLSDLIPRFYDPQQGSILIDGIDIRNYKLDSLHSHMGIVAQETILFNDTIEENIKLGNRKATSEQVEQAAKIANAHNFILETENGYQTNIGDRGMKLSGGQRQRLSIARAVLKDPDILILDEATSALDTESEKLVQSALESLLKGRTSLVIAHRLSTISNVDRIIVIDQGTIMEQGTHSELIERKGMYAKLIEMQQL